MIGQLHEANAGTAASLRLFHLGDHELAANTLVLHLWVNRDRSQTDDRRAQIDEVAAKNATSILGDHTVELRMVQQKRGNVVGGLGESKSGGNRCWSEMLLKAEYNTGATAAKSSRLAGRIVIDMTPLSLGFYSV